MSSRYEIKDGDDATQDLFNRIFSDIDLRVADLEKAGSALQQAKNEIVSLGLKQINNVIVNASSAIESISELSDFFRAKSDSELALGLGTKEVIIEEGDRENFAAPLFVAIAVDGQLDNWMAGQTQSWDKETGQLFVNVTHAKGGGTFSDWIVTATQHPETGPTLDAYTKAETNDAINQVKSEVKSELLGGVGAAFDTLKELADARGEDVDAIAALTATVGQKANISALEGNTLPLGSVIFLCVDVAPPGFLPAKGQSFDPLVYPEFYAAYGKTTMPNIANRVIRGDGMLAGNVDDYQEDAFQGHGHGLFVQDNVAGGGGGNSVYRTSNNGTNNDAIGAPISDGINGTPRTASETRVKSWIGYPIVKVSSAYVNQGTTDLAALENAINSAVRNDIPQTFADGGAQVRENIGVKNSIWEPIQEYDITSVVGSLSFTNLSEYRELRLRFVLKSVTDNVSLFVRTSTNNGASYDNQPSDYSWCRHYGYQSGNASDGSINHDLFKITPGVRAGNDAFISGLLHLTQFNQNEYCPIFCEWTMRESSGNVLAADSNGYRKQKTARDAFLVSFSESAAGIAKGYVRLEGLK